MPALVLLHHHFAFGSPTLQEVAHGHLSKLCRTLPILLAGKPKMQPHLSWSASAPQLAQEPQTSCCPCCLRLLGLLECCWSPLGWAQGAGLRSGDLHVQFSVPSTCPKPPSPGGCGRTNPAKSNTHSGNASSARTIHQRPPCSSDAQKPWLGGAGLAVTYPNIPTMFWIKLQIKTTKLSFGLKATSQHAMSLFNFLLKAAGQAASVGFPRANYTIFWCASYPPTLLLIEALTATTYKKKGGGFLGRPSLNRIPSPPPKVFLHWMGAKVRK